MSKIFTSLTDGLNDEQLDRLAKLLSLRKTIRQLGEQRDMYVRNHTRRCAELDAEVARTEAQITEVLEGPARRFLDEYNGASTGGAR